LEWFTEEETVFGKVVSAALLLVDALPAGRGSCEDIDGAGRRSEKSASLVAISQQYHLWSERT
jgi:hypothetical protein